MEIFVIIVLVCVIRLLFLGGRMYKIDDSGESNINFSNLDCNGHSEVNENIEFNNMANLEKKKIEIHDKIAYVSNNGSTLYDLARKQLDKEKKENERHEYFLSQLEQCVYSDDEFLQRVISDYVMDIASERNQDELRFDYCPKCHQTRIKLTLPNMHLTTKYGVKLKYSIYYGDLIICPNCKECSGLEYKITPIPTPTPIVTKKFDTYPRKQTKHRHAFANCKFPIDAINMLIEAIKSMGGEVRNVDNCSIVFSYGPIGYFLLVYSSRRKIWKLRLLKEFLISQKSDYGLTKQLTLQGKLWNNVYMHTYGISQKNFLFNLQSTYQMDCSSGLIKDLVDSLTGLYDMITSNYEVYEILNKYEKKRDLYDLSDFIASSDVIQSKDKSESTNNNSENKNINSMMSGTNHNAPVKVIGVGGGAAYSISNIIENPLEDVEYCILDNYHYAWADVKYPEKASYQLSLAVPSHSGT